MDGFDGEWVVHHGIYGFFERFNVLSALGAGRWHFPHDAGNVPQQQPLHLLLCRPKVAENVACLFSVLSNDVNFAHR